MNLFNIIPENFFSILASPNRNVYLSALVVLHRCYRAELSIRKTDYIAELIAELNRANLIFEVEDEEEMPEDNISGRAHLLLRKLVATGWVEEETQGETLEDALVVPDYAVNMLNLFHDLTHYEHQEYNRYVYSTYSILKNANQEKDDYLFEALDQAWRNTDNLVSDLKSLLGNIRRYHQVLFQQADVQSVLVKHFDQFAELIEKKVYHPIKTFDSVPRFKAAILRILYAWREDVGLKDRISELALGRNPNRFNDINSCRLEVQRLLDDIIGHYETIEGLIAEIDRKHRRYLLAAHDRIQYLLQSDETIKGKLVHMLNTLPKMGEQDMGSVLEQHLQLYRVAHFTEQDLFTPRKRRMEFAPDPLRLRSSLDMEAVQNEVDNFTQRVRQGFDQRRIFSFMDKQFGNRKTLGSQDLELENQDDFILTLLAVLRHDDPESFYKVAFGDCYILNSGFRLPEMTFTRTSGVETGE